MSLKIYDDFMKETDEQNAVFRFTLKNTQAAQEYLSSRQIPQDIIETFRLGFGADTCSQYQYRNRITMPITEPKGQISGWVSRAIDKNATAKTLYSPNSLFFQKSVAVFGIQQAIYQMFTSHQVFLVEGPFDVMRMHQLGVKNVLGILGTNPTEGQLKTIRMLAEHIVLLLDGDAAGRRGMQAIKEKAAKHSFASITQVNLPDNEDPDSLGLKNPKQLLDLITLSTLR